MPPDGGYPHTLLFRGEIHVNELLLNVVLHA
jgi:hypothetical protein